MRENSCPFKFIMKFVPFILFSKNLKAGEGGQNGDSVLEPVMQELSTDTELAETGKDAKVLVLKAKHANKETVTQLQVLKY